MWLSTRRCAASLRYRRRAEITGSCVQTEALLVSGVVFVSAQKLSVIVWTLLKTWAKLFLMKEYVKFKCLNCGIKIFNKMGPWRAGNEFQFPALIFFSKSWLPNLKCYNLGRCCSQTDVQFMNKSKVLVDSSLRCSRPTYRVNRLYSPSAN